MSGNNFCLFIEDFNAVESYEKLIAPVAVKDEF